jgi:hypothetical protein
LGHRRKEIEGEADHKEKEEMYTDWKREDWEGKEGNEWSLGHRRQGEYRGEEREISGQKVASED